VRRLRRRVRLDERGASLVLAIAFMVVAGLIGATLLRTTVSSSALGRVQLNNVRNRQYDADAAIERSIARIRGVNPITGSYTSACASADTMSGVNNAAQSYRVNCAYSPSVATGPNPSGDPVSPNNITFLACLNTGAACTDSTAIVTARVNFQSVSGQTVTFVQSWSVNK
jgi:hypothetical protein